jgi:dolichol kinase
VNPFIGISVVLAITVTLFVVLRALQKRYGLAPEWVRKLTHIGSGLTALSFPWLFQSAWPAVSVCAIAALGLFVLRNNDRMEWRLVIDSVDRHSYGEFYFALAIALVFTVSGGDPLTYIIPVLILAGADTAAAMVGLRYGRAQYNTLSGKKTVEGSLACFATAFLLTYVTLFIATDIVSIERLGISLLVAFVSTTVEAAGTRGLDNLLIPVFAFLILKAAIGRDLTGIAVVTGVALVAFGFAFLMKGGGLRDREDNSKNGGVTATAARTGWMKRPAGFSRRMGRYFREMLPLPPHAALAILIYVGIAVYARHIHELSTPLFSPYGVAGAWTLFNLMIVLRLMDELKDEEIDQKLFPDRALPSGRVLRSDIQWALAGASAIYLLVNVWCGWAFYLAAGTLGYAFLMFRRFFAPDLLKRSLPLTLATHNPIVALMILYVFGMFAVEHGISAEGLRWRLTVPFVLMLWSPFLAWELARKIRCKEDEDDYVTYSQLLGPRGAVAVTWAVQAIGLGTAFCLWLTLGLHWVYVAVVTCGFIVNVWAGIRFLTRPTPRTSKLKPFASFFLVTVLASQVAAIGVIQG